jgi:putative restriction endonuclease
MSSPLAQSLVGLAPRHRAALEWFESHSGEVVPWPRPLADGTLLVTKAKGIYKPEWTEYALSIRRTLAGPYPDEEVRDHEDGTWSLKYFQESLDLEIGRARFTNIGLFRCFQDVVPVGVLSQVRGKPNVAYKVLGLAIVAEFGDGFFTFQGLSTSALRDSSLAGIRVPGPDDPRTRADALAGAFTQPFDLAQFEDDRRRVTRAVAQRQGQAGFRRILLDAYGSKCLMTGYDAVDALEAAHIVPYRGPVTNHPSNGLLMRADLHNLFDLGLISIDVERSSPRVILADTVRESRYAALEGQLVSLPSDPRYCPSAIALRQHREWAGL